MFCIISDLWRTRRRRTRLALSAGDAAPLSLWFVSVHPSHSLLSVCRLLDAPLALLPDAPALDEDVIDSHNWQEMVEPHVLTSLSSREIDRQAVIYGTHARTHTHTHTHSHTRTRAHAHAHTHIRTRTHAHIRMCTHTRAHTHAHTRMHARARTHMHARTHTRTRAHIHTHAHIHMHTHTHSLTHMHTHTHIHAHTHTHTFYNLLRLCSASFYDYTFERPSAEALLN